MTLFFCLFFLVVFILLVVRIRKFRSSTSRSKDLQITRLGRVEPVFTITKNVRSASQERALYMASQSDATFSISKASASSSFEPSNGGQTGIFPWMSDNETRNEVNEIGRESYKMIEINSLRAEEKIKQGEFGLDGSPFIESKLCWMTTFVDERFIVSVGSVSEEIRKIYDSKGEFLRIERLFLVCANIGGVFLYFYYLNKADASELLERLKSFIR